MSMYSTAPSVASNSILRCLFATLLALIGTSAWAASSVTSQLFKIQAGGADKANGDYVSASDTSNGTTGEDTFYQFYIEVPTGLSNLNVELFDADFGQGAANDALRGTSFNNSSTIYTLIRPNGTTANTITGSNASPAGYNNAWTSLHSETNPANGHWRLTVDSHTSSGDDVNGFGIRAYDGAGNEGAGGIELPIYSETMVQIGHITPNSSLTTTLYPYVTSDCSLKVVDFDFDVGGGGGLDGTVTVNNRLGGGISLPGPFSGNDVWAANTGANGDSTTNRNVNGIWSSDIEIVTASPNNYGNVAYGTTSMPSTPNDSVVPSSYRIYLPSDVGGAPRKPYLSQYYVYASGTNPPANNQDTFVRVVVLVTNPTQRAITFSATNLVSSNAPSSARTSYQGSATVSQGTITSAPSVGSDGNIAWNPGTVSAGATAVMTYLMQLRPNNANPTLNVVGPFGTNGTSATWLDETGNSAQGRATFTFGQLCGMQLSMGVVVPTPVTLSSIRSHRSGKSVVAEWTTATETQNVGFKLITDQLKSASEAVESSLIASKVVDSIAPQIYSASLQTASDHFWLDDVDVHGKATRHGPYVVGKVYGDATAPEPIDWTGIDQLNRASLVRKSAARVQAAVLEINADGIHRLTHEQLLAAGIDLSGVAASSVSLVRKGQVVPRRVGGGQVFGSGSFVEFVGVAGHGVYGKKQQYLLSIDADRSQDVARITEKPLRISTAKVRAVSTLDTQNFYSFASPVGDPWFMDRMLAYRNAPARLAVKLPLFARIGNDPISVRLNYWGVTDWPGVMPDHSLNVLDRRGALLAEWQGDGLGAASLDVEFAHERSAELNFDLELTGATGYDFDLIHLESVSAEYTATAKALNQTWQGRNVEVDKDADGFYISGFNDFDVIVYRKGQSGMALIESPEHYFPSAGCCAVKVPLGELNSEFWAAQKGALLVPKVRPAPALAQLPVAATDYLIVTHPMFASAVERLAAHHRSHGLKVTVVDTDQIYRSLSDGATSVQAIDDFIAYASMELGARYVLLVGGDTYDYDDNLQLGSVSFIPTHYQSINGQVRYAPTDAPYADIDGDLLPDVALGRLPVRTTAELNALIDKLTQQPSSGRPADALFVSAQSEPGIDFTARAAALGDALGEGITRKSLSVDRIGVDSVRTQMQTALNKGPSLVTYVGHSGVDRWSYDPLLIAPEAAVLANSTSPSVYIQWGCWNTYFVSPYFNSMAHALLLGSGGASSVIGAAALTDADGHQALGAVMYPLLSSGDRIGDALVKAKRSVDPKAQFFRETALGVNLLGDPAARVF